MSPFITKSVVGRVAFFLACAVCVKAVAGGSGLNTIVIANSASSNSCDLANYYCESRAVPPENVIYISWPGVNTSWTSDQFQTNLLTPLLSAISSRQLTSQIDYVVLSMDIPFETVYGTTVNSTTAALFYGLKPDGGVDWKGVTNSYFASEAIFSTARPASAPGYSFLATMITGESLELAEKLVDQGVQGDGTFTSHSVILAKSSDPSRNVRYPEFDNAIFNARLRGNYSMVRTNSDDLSGLGNLLGYETGLANFVAPAGMFLPGAMADSLSSFGGVIFGSSGQTSLLAFIEAGAAGSYGTVTEPFADPTKFPDPQAYFYQARGFSLAESYYQSINTPYEGLIVGEPLTAPFAQTAYGQWGDQLVTNAVLSGTAILPVSFTASDSAHPLNQIDLFIDGKYFQTLTNVGPRPGNVLTVWLNGYPVSYTVPGNATIAGITSDLASVLNATTNSVITKVAAFARGDRVELRNTDGNDPSAPFYFDDNFTNLSGNHFYRASYVPGPIAPSMKLPVANRDGTFRLHVETPTPFGFTILASSDLHGWSPIFTSAGPGPADFLDATAANFSQRFYRVSGFIANPQPTLSALPPSYNGAFGLHVDSPALSPCVIESSTSLPTWTPLFTNLVGGTMDFVDSQSAAGTNKFYRAFVPPPPIPQLPGLGTATGGAGSLVSITNAAQPYVLEFSTNQSQWSPVLTNLTIGRMRIAAGSATGAADALTTFINPAQDTFLDSVANGICTFSINGLISVGTWLELNVTKVNGAVVTLAVTNSTAGGGIIDLAGQMVALINSAPGLQGADGIVASDLGTGGFGAVVFNLSARSPGLQPAGIQVVLRGASGLLTSPAGQTALNSNLSDLQPRNHAYVTAGAGVLGGSFQLDTTAIADGFHDLTAVAYEGSHAHTETIISLPIQIQNTPLTANLNLVDLGSTGSINGTYHVQVTSSAGQVNTIQLYSTGGMITQATNQSAATFTVNGFNLGAGLHPFYAVIKDGNGKAFRTDTRWVRLVR